MLIDTTQFQTKHLANDAELPAERTALIIVDMMRRFCDPAWLSGGNEESKRWFTAELQTVIPNLRSILDAFRSSGGLVVHVVNAKWTAEAREAVPYQRGRDYDYFDSHAMSVVDELAPQRDEIIVRKLTSSAFTGTGLDYMLNNAGIKNVVLTGQYGGACVFYSLIQSREYGFANYWPRDAILHASAVDQAMITPLVGTRWATLATSAQIAQAVSRHPAQS
jgi:nicotinamidase-related amidase